MKRLTQERSILHFIMDFFEKIYYNINLTGLVIRNTLKLRMKAAAGRKDCLLLTAKEPCAAAHVWIIRREELGIDGLPEGS